MSAEISLPQLGVEMKYASLTEWVYQDGAEVRTGDVVAIVETDKVTYEIEAPGEGVLHHEAVPGEEYYVGHRLGVVTAADEQYLAPNRDAAVSEAAKPPETPDTSARIPEPAGTAPTPVTAPTPDGKILATPLARRVAADLGIDMGSVTGSGPRGVIRRRDVDAAKAEPSVTAPVQVEPPSEQGTPFTPMRRAIAERMHRSLQTTAQMTDVREVDVTALAEFRAALANKVDRIGFKVSFNDLFLKATAMALRKHPELNATVHDDRVIQHDHVHLGMAVSVPEGLIVPVLRDADRLTIRALHERSEELAAEARERAVTAEDVSGGTFTVTNIGSYGSHFGTPVLNLPQVGILATGAVLDRPVVRDGDVVAGKVVHLSLTVDHRVIDGEAAGRFHTTLARLLAEPDTLLLG